MDDAQFEALRLTKGFNNLFCFIQHVHTSGLKWTKEPLEGASNTLPHYSEKKKKSFTVKMKAVVQFITAPMRSGVFILWTFSSRFPAAHLRCTWHQPHWVTHTRGQRDNTRHAQHNMQRKKNAPELHRTVQHHHHLCLPFEFFWKRLLLQREIHTFQLVAHTHTRVHTHTRTHKHFCPHLVTIQQDVCSLCSCVLKRTLSQPSVGSVLLKVHVLISGIAAACWDCTKV